MKTLLSFLIKLYQACVSPFLGNNCRFEPTCSNYTQEAIEKHGAVWGGWLGLKRICKCHPYYKGKFYDPVPERALPQGDPSAINAENSITVKDHGKSEPEKPSGR